MTNTDEALDLTTALSSLQRQLGMLLHDLALLHSTAVPDRPEVVDICLHVESLIVEAEAVLAFPELLGPTPRSQTLH